jgi:hypothetical protein
MQLVLCRNRSLGSWLIRLLTWGRWSHSAILDSQEELVYDSSFLHGGCRVWTWEQFQRMYPVREVRTLNVHDAASGRYWLERQIGKGYDWTALVGFAFRRDWQLTDRWFCSEHTETFIANFCRPRFRASITSRVTPAHQDMLV